MKSSNNLDHLALLVLMGVGVVVALTRLVAFLRKRNQVSQRSSSNPSMDVDLQPAIRQVEAELASEPSTGLPGRPVLAIIDDNPFTLESWKLMVLDARVLAFSSPEEFFELAFADPTFLEMLDLVVVDYYFEKGGNGVEFAKALGHHSEVPIFLSTNAVGLDYPQELFCAQISKDPHSFSQLRELLDSAS